MTTQRSPSSKDKPAQTLGEYLEEARQEAGLSLRQLARLSGVAMSTVNRLLKDEVDLPAPDHLVAVARALELSATDLFLLAGLPLPNQAASLDVMLRKGYGVSDEEVPALKRQIEALIAEHVKPDEHHADQPRAPAGKRAKDRGT